MVSTMNVSMVEANLALMVIAWKVVRGKVWSLHEMHLTLSKQDPCDESELGFGNL
jgi:hypothetical protein